MFTVRCGPVAWENIHEHSHIPQYGGWLKQDLCDPGNRAAILRSVEATVKNAGATGLPGYLHLK